MGIRKETIDDVVAEMDEGYNKFGAYQSAHEAIAVIREEYLELEEEVFKKREDQLASKLINEAIQLAAVSMRFAIELRKIEEIKKSIPKKRKTRS